MRRRIVALAVVALLSVAGCDAAFGGSGPHCRHGDKAPRSQPTGSSTDFQDG